jgi:predicted phage tail protein
LNVKEDESERKLIKSGLYKISILNEKNSPFKVHTRELNDTLALGKSKEELVKIFTEEEEKKNGGFRFIVGIAALKKVLMFRGNSLNVLKI